MYTLLQTALRVLLGGAPPRQAPRAPDGCCLYAIGDIHGELDLLRRMLDRIHADARRRLDEEGCRASIVFLGDYVDRGADSKGVIDLLADMQCDAGTGQGVACHFLLGNHEAALLDFLADPVANAGWLAFGGVEALMSYGVRASVGTTDPDRLAAIGTAFADRLPGHHRAFLERLDPLVVLGDYLFVHAGIRPGVALDQQAIDDLVGIREPFLSSAADYGKVIVHGHTIVDRPVISRNRIAIDTGAYATGILTAVALACDRQDVLQVGN